MMTVWTLVMVLATEPYVNLSLLLEFRSETECQSAVQIAKISDEDRSKLKCIAIQYPAI